MVCGRVVVCGVICLSFAGSFSDLPLGRVSADSGAFDHSQQCESARDCFIVRDFSATITRFPDSVWALRSRFLIGAGLIENGDLSGRSMLEHLSNKLPLIADYVQWSLAKSYFIEHAFVQAARRYRLITQRYPESPLAYRARYFEGIAWYRAGDCESATRALTAVFEGHSDDMGVTSGLRPIAGVHLAACYLERGNKASAASIMWRVWTDMPHLVRDVDTQAMTAAFGALKISDEHATAEQLWRRATSFFEVGDYSRAADTFDIYLRVAMTRRHGYRLDGQVKRGIALVKTRRLTEAQAILENVIQQSPSYASPEAYLWLARTYLRLGAGGELLALSQQVADVPLPLSIRVSILYFLGLWHEDQQSVLEARKTYQYAVNMAADGYADVQVLYDILWQLAWIHIREGRYDEALEVLDRIIASHPNRRRGQRAMYWKAVSLDRLGNAEESRITFLDLCKNFPHGYYCQNTRFLLGVPPSGEVRLHKLDTAARTDQFLGRVQEMILVGLSDDAMRLMKTSFKDDVDTLGQYLAVSRCLQSVGNTFQSLWLMKRYFGDIIRGGHNSVPPFFWELAYPKTYMPVIREVIAEDQAYWIDPYVIAALIREESAFNANARSHAGALGLMQIIPHTAYQIARFLRVKPFDANMLFDPYLNIRFGVSYFRSLLKQFNGNVILSIAGYNAGPTVVARWRDEIAQTVWQSGGRISYEERFIESIPYEETRSYVKRVLQTVREYHRVNETGCTIGFLDKQCSTPYRS